MRKPRTPWYAVQTVEKLQFFDKYARRHKWLWAREF